MRVGKINSAAVGEISMEKLNISPELFARFSEKLDKEIGLQLPKTCTPNWEEKIQALTDAFGFKTAVDCLSWLTRASLGQREHDILAKYLTVGETYFFRDSNAFKALAEEILPLLIKQRLESKSIRIWCAACCTGEEPYSIAILLHQLIPDIEQWNIHLVGTDLNVEFLKKCELGIYKEWSFRSTPPDIRKTYFVKGKDGEQLRPDIRKLVKFMYLNLVEDKYPLLINGTQAMDVIFCNNILIYFTPEKIRQVVVQLSKALVDGGWLITSAVEVPYIHEKQLMLRKINEGTFFQKTAASELLEEKPIPRKKRDVHEPKVFPKEIKYEEKKTLSTQTQPLKADIQKMSADLYEQGQYVELIELLEKSFETRSNRMTDFGTQEILLLAKSYANVGKLENALKWIQSVLKIEKLNPDAYLFLGILYQEMELIEEAIQALNKALFLDSRLVLGYYILGSLFLKQKKINEADRNFKNALKLLFKEDSLNIVRGSDGMTAGRLRELLSNSQELE